MGGDGRDKNRTGGIPSQDYKTDCGDEVAEVWWQVMGVGICERGAGVNRYLVNK